MITLHLKALAKVWQVLIKLNRVLVELRKYLLNMIIKKHIENTIVMLDARYNQALLSPTPQDAIYFSKLAILEYGGWIEESFDVIIKRTVKGKLKTQIYQNIHAKDIIKPNFGFEYKKHFRTMMYKSVGLVATELIEKHLNDTGKLQIFESELDSLKTHRDDAAHTW